MRPEQDVPSQQAFQKMDWQFLGNPLTVGEVGFWQHTGVSIRSRPSAAFNRALPHVAAALFAGSLNRRSLVPVNRREDNND